MAQTKVQDGNDLNLTLADDVVSGGLVVQGNIVAVAGITALAGETIACEVVGVHRLPKASADNIDAGDTIYAKAGEITSSLIGSVKCGYAVKAAAGGVLTIDIRFVPNC
jgi:predicted RecA/RadA family phage recombinase